jgi:hypothetical protein
MSSCHGYRIVDQSPAGRKIKLAGDQHGEAVEVKDMTRNPRVRDVELAA